MRVVPFAVAASLVFFLSNCGYVGPIMPPSADVPNPVKDLTAVQRGNKIEISFHTPPRNTDSLSIKQFTDIDLRIGVDPIPFDFEIWEKDAKPFPIPPPPPGDPLDPKALPVSASVPTEGFIGQHVAVAVRTSARRGKDHFSSWSNRVVLDVIQSLETPKSVKIAASADGVVLDWPPVDRATNYRILRQAPGDKDLSEIGKSDTPHFVDTTSQFEVPYSYQVVALSHGAESLPSEILTITPIDKFPPSVPSGVTALAGPESIEVSWQRSPEADTAGYYIHRSVNGGAFERVGPMQNLPAFSDRQVERGKTYRYQISSVDQKNNESERSPAVEVAF